MNDIFLTVLRTTLTVRYLAIWILCAVLLSVAGPFGTYETHPFHVRLPYWFLVAAVSSILGHTAFNLSATLVNPQRVLLVDLVATVLMTALFTPFLYLLTHAILVMPPSPGPSFGMLASYVAPVALVVYTSRRLIPGMTEIGYVPEPEPQAEPPRIVRRLPEVPDGPILRLSSDDHQIDVVTARQCYRIRLRFTDAIDEMDGIEGYCTHRSHWVARDAIAGWEKQNGKLVLRLTNGDIVPVSRKYRPLLEEAGIFQDAARGMGTA